MVKICTKCGIEKSTSDFYLIKGTRNFRSACRDCVNLAHRNYYAKNRVCLAALNKKYRERHRDRLLSLHREYYQQHKGRLQHTQRIWYLKNKDHVVARNGRYAKRRAEADIGCRLAGKLRTRLYLAVKNSQKFGSAVRDLGCSIPELKLHLERQFQEGMVWKNYGKWHIDHVIPLSKFDLTDFIQFQKACHYTNLQPLWAEDNIRKGNKIL